MVVRDLTHTRRQRRGQRLLVTVHFTSQFRSYLQSWSAKVLKYFELLPSHGISVHPPLPTPNTILMLIHPM